MSEPKLTAEKINLIGRIAQLIEHDPLSDPATVRVNFLNLGRRVADLERRVRALEGEIASKTPTSPAKTIRPRGK